MFRESQTIGPYKLIRMLERSVFGEVWLAQRQRGFVTTEVAIKLPLDEWVDREAIRKEAMLWERIGAHPNVLPIIEADEYDGQIVIASEYAPDASLEQMLKTHGKLPVKQAVEMTVGILNGLEFLHLRYIIHRDLKPSNIFLNNGTPRLGDFGISRATGALAFLSPEALNGRYSTQTDIWSVGVILYQLLTGTLPFPQQETASLISAIIMHEYKPLPDFVPLELNRIIAGALAKLPESRYQTAVKMREDLGRLLKGNWGKTISIKPDSPSYDDPSKRRSTVTPTQLFCSYCESRNNTENVFCLNCGLYLVESQQKYPGDDFLSSTKSPQNFPVCETQSNEYPPSIAGDGADKERKTDSVGNIVKRIRNFFKKNI